MGKNHSIGIKRPEKKKKKGRQLYKEKPMSEKLISKGWVTNNKSCPRRGKLNSQLNIFCVIVLFPMIWFYYAKV